MNQVNSEIINLITNRRSHRKYVNKKIPKDIIEIIINCGRNAPFGGKPKPDCQVTEYIVIEDQKIKDAPIIIAVLANKDNDPKYKEYILSSALSIENMILAAESFGIGTCVLSCFLYHEKHVEDKRISREILNLPDNIELVALLSLGYKDDGEEIPDKELRTYKETVHFDTYDN